MGDNSAIEWTDATWNPLIGCSRTSPGCDKCYAVGVVHRGMAEQHKGLTIRRGGRTDWTGEVREAPSVLDAPLRWKRPRRIFVNSLSDLFHENVQPWTIAEILGVAALAPQHTFQVLTKRAKRMARLMDSEDIMATMVEEAMERIAGERGWCPPDLTWPLPNVWLGVSIESDRYSFRADHLRDTPAAVRWISAEPLLGPLPSLSLERIDWLVVGGESGPGARPMEEGWARELLERGSAPGTAVNFKQAGRVLGRAWGCTDSKGGKLEEMPEAFRVRQFPA